VATAAALDGEGWLHTGDLAYRDPEGYFFVVGRSKELIIKGGMNIAPKQIDEVLESHPAVLEAATVGVPDRYVGEDLVAFAVLRAGKTCQEKELLSFCESRLGHFKTPTRIHFVQDLPKGPSGKVQRLRLVEEAARPDFARTPSLGVELGMERTGGSLGQGGLAPSESSIQQIIAQTWADLLVQPQIDAQSNFFALGGHSLLAIQCLSRLREKLPVMLSLSDFFENATVAQQAGLVRKRWTGAPAEDRADAGQTGMDPIPPRDRTLPCPLSPAQQRIWFFEQLVPGVPLYNESEAVRLEGDLNVDAMEQALNVIVTRHEILRSTIQISDGQPTVKVHESWPLRFKRIDLSAVEAAQRQEEVQRLLIEEPRLPYHLEAEPGIRATLLRLGTREHVFILMMHHLVCDWSSEGVLWREMSAAYRAFSRGEPLALAPLSIQHGDYAAWQQQQMAETRFAKDLAFWEENLRGAPELLELPADRPRPRTNSYRGARQRFRLGTRLAEALRECSRREKVSLFTVFAAALNALLYRYTGQEDILVGIPLADRERAELQSVIGFLLHTQVLRTRLGGDMTFRELLAAVQKGVLDLYTHCAVPFDQIVNKLHPDRNLSYSPLFQVMLNWRDREQLLSFIGMDGLVVESLLAESRTSKFDLLLILTDGGDEIWVEIEYNTDLFDDNRIVRLVSHYQTLLEAVAGDADRPLARLPLLTDLERQQILIDWNRMREELSADSCIQDLVAEQSKHNPEATAVVFEDRRLTYRQLNERANQLARHLQKLGVGPDIPVGIFAERSLEMVVGVLGILKAGGAYVPLDPEYPRERLGFMLEDARASVVLTQKRLSERVPAGNARVICLDSDWPLIERESVDNPKSGAGLDNLVYILYTSGSTGQPKGVAMVHRAVANLISWQCGSPAFSKGLKTLQFASLGFDVSFQEMFSTWCSGGTLVLVSEDLRRDFGSLLRFLQKQAVQRLYLPFVALEHLAEIAVHQQLLPSSLREVITAGEQLQITADIRSLFESLQGCSLQNQYGPTEAHVVTAFTLTGPPAEWPKLPPIGRPISNTSIFILDEAKQPVPIGVPGELHIGGECLARGYLNRSELTAQRFISVPLHTGEAARLYKTGDLARFLSDGNIEFLGRSDFQVKIRGFRVETGEVEAVLKLHPAVQQALVMAREDRPGDKRLVAYVTLRDGGIASSELRSYLAQKLPEYMVPAAFVVLEKLPLSRNGKVDRKALPAPDLQAAAGRFVAPETLAEKVLAKIWGEALGLEQVGLHDNFFDLGGHSLLLLRVQPKLCGALKTSISIVEMFQYPTIRSLARHISQRSAGPERLQKVQERARLRTEAFGRRRESREKQL
jgi:amino acid adenylation domain-containing protein